MLRSSKATSHPEPLLSVVRIGSHQYEVLHRHGCEPEIVGTPLPAGRALLQAALSQASEVPHRAVSVTEAVGRTLMRIAEGKASVDDASRAAIECALRRHDWNGSRAAPILGIGRSTLYRKLKDMEIAS